MDGIGWQLHLHLQVHQDDDAAPRHVSVYLSGRAFYFVTKLSRVKSAVVGGQDIS